MLVFFISIFLIILMLLFCVAIEYNKLKKLQLKVEQSRAAITIYLKEKFDLIPNLINVIKEYNKYEEGTLEKIINLRNEYNKTKDIKTGEKLDKEVSNLMLTVEAYPELKSNTLFVNLQENLSRLEVQIQSARRLYNSDVTIYNTSLEIVPLNIVAKLLSFKKEELLTYDVNENVEVKF